MAQPTERDAEIGAERSEDGNRGRAIRERVVHPFRRRRQDEPALAPFETDAEAGNFGGRYAGEPLRRDDRGRPLDPARGQAAGAGRPGTDPGDRAEIRIGPGDAGARRKARVLPERMQGRGGGSGCALAVIGLGLAIGAVAGFLV
jgi:hypothetical protein